MKRVAIYARVSTNGQSVTNQLRELRQVAPQFDKLCQAATRREIDLIMSWSVDRLGRSLQHLVTFLGEIHAKGVDLYLHQQGVDTSTPAGKALFQMCGVFAEFERSMIQERVKAGLKRAVAQGKKLGRPRVSTSIERKVRTRRTKGMGIKAIARKLGIGTGTVQRIVKEAA